MFTYIEEGQHFGRHGGVDFIRNDGRSWAVERRASGRLSLDAEILIAGVELN